MSAIIDVVESSDKKGIVPIDNSEIYDWATRNVVLTGQYQTTGPFSIGNSTYLIEPFKSIKDYSTKEIVILKAVQTGGSMVNDILLHWIIANRPMPVMCVMQTNKAAADHMKSRIIPSLINCDIIQDLLPADKRKMSREEIVLPHMQLYVHGPSKERLQSKSIGYLCCDEVWRWEQGILEQARARTTAFMRNGLGKIVIISQAGIQDDDLDKAYRNGTMEEWTVPCLQCNEYFIPDIALMTIEGNKKWNDKSLGFKNDNGTYNYGKISPLLRMKCPKCGFEHIDNPETKTKWALQGKYLQTNIDNVIPGHRSFRWNSFIVDSWQDLTIKFLEACYAKKRGVTELIKEYFQQRMAKSISPEDLYMRNRVIKYSNSDYNSKDKWQDEMIRYYTIDVQEDKFVGLIRAWSPKGNSRLIWFGAMLSIDEVVSKIKEWGIPEGCTWIDTGHRTREIYSYIIKYHLWGIKGDKERDGYIIETTQKNGSKTKFKRFTKRSELGGNPNITANTDGKMGNAPFYLFAVKPLKQILETLRDGNTSLIWETLPLDTYNIESYKKQMFSEYLHKEINKYGKEIQYYRKVNSEPNDYFDLETYQVGLALMDSRIDLQEHSLPSSEYSKNDHIEDNANYSNEK